MTQQSAPWFIDRLSFCSVPIVGWSSSDEVGPATGFYWRMEHRVFLISNWHVFSGRRPRDGQPVQRNCLIPDRLEVIIQVADPGTSGRVRERRATVRLWSKATTGDDVVANWLQHPVQGQDVDVAAIEVGGSFSHNERKRIQCVNDAPNVGDIVPYVGADVFVIGFPLRPDASWPLPLPIWKRGSIATEPDVPFRKKSSFLVDSTTKDGMSGSPVVFRSLMAPMGDGNTTFSTQPVTKFLGVYSGRELSTNNSDTQLGVVWKTDYIEDICRSGIAGLDRYFGTAGVNIDAVR